MKIFSKLLFFIFLPPFIACSSEAIDDNKNTDEPSPIVKVLDIVNSEKIADTPSLNLNTHIVHKDNLFSVGEKSTYMFDFQAASWTLISTDNKTPNGGAGSINFIRNEKWYMFTVNGLYEFNFSNKEWKTIKSISNSTGLFSAEGFYIEADQAIYFTSPENSNTNIYKYNLITNELSTHKVNGSIGLYGGVTYNNSLIINNTYYNIRPSANTITISKFNEDFTSLTTINTFKGKQGIDFSQSTAIKYGNYIIFGLGGVPTVDNNNSIINDPSVLSFYYYDTVNEVFTEMPTPFYESCRLGSLITYKNEFYLIDGKTIKNKKNLLRNKIEKLEFDFVTP
ncbi:hypothetical protein [Tenacibaculum sp. nBUS_03]|uniref:hypothetical protein n=1 Tax=Tenacibaculum sp. nBUS_03 TaxID=3395320 RepID=UPI003EBC912C